MSLTQISSTAPDGSSSNAAAGQGGTSSEQAARSWGLVLTSRGIATTDDLVPPQVISEWKAALDPLFATSATKARAYVDAGQLAELGILAQCCTPGLRALMSALTPYPVLYHCHAYEVAANQETPHIHQGILRGWHRDDETVPGNDMGRARYLSCFVYLSDVGEDGGAFELVPRPPRWGIQRGEAAVRVVGPAGTTFVWNRTYFHRASPNRAPRRRRLLKLSWQSAERPNPRLQLDEFARARRCLGDGDAFLASLLGASPTGATPPDAEPLDALVPQTLAATDRVRVSRPAALASGLMSLRQLVER